MGSFQSTITKIHYMHHFSAERVSFNSYLVCLLNKQLFSAQKYANNRSTIVDFPQLYDPDVHPFDLGKLEYYNDDHYGTRENFSNIICESYETFLKRYIVCIKQVFISNPSFNRLGTNRPM